MTPEDMCERKFPLEPLTPGQTRMNNTIEQGLNLALFEDSIGVGIVYKTADPKLELAYLGLGISDEAGEVAGKIKKYLRGDYSLESLTDELSLIVGQNTIDDHNADVQARRDAIALELGDTLWYLTRLAHVLGFTLSDIMKLNMNKLADRRDRGVTKGDGDNR